MILFAFSDTLKSAGVPVSKIWRYAVYDSHESYCNSEALPPASFDFKN